jgi:AraC family transcriptional regulator, transcriptional activator of pobA
MIPYKWEYLSDQMTGVYCIFNNDFFQQFGNINQYEVFQPKGTHVFELTDEQKNHISEGFDQMEKEFHSDYKYKYDLIRNMVFDMIHFALKLQPTAIVDHKVGNAAQRISAIFLELLERQFPIEENHPRLKVRNPSEFATQLNVHVNHLNRAVKQTIHKTTSQIVADRILQEAKILLKHSHWNISEIAYALGFTELSHFNNFFKKHTDTTATRFRSS